MSLASFCGALVADPLNVCYCSLLSPAAALDFLTGFFELFEVFQPLPAFYPYLSKSIGLFYLFPVFGAFR